jgi:tRNA 2-selenouridine synthase
LRPIEPQELIDYIGCNTLIDVRTPAEFESGHIPGAVNIPIFSNEERAEVGTLYKQKSRKAAMLRALEVVGPKMADFVREASKYKYTEHLIIHCWRGGMRSSTFAWLLNTADIPAVTLKKGYKGFRNYIFSFFEQVFDIRILTGCTGSGKSELLRYMKALGQQVVDLERLANHKGSSFGALGQNPQPTSEQFHNDLFWSMKDFDIKKPVWMEDESMNIGKVFIPEPLWKQMRSSPLFRVDLCLQERLNRLVNEYACFDKDALSSAIERISKRVGGQNTKLALDELEKKNYMKVAEILLAYYDKSYNKSIEERKNQIVFRDEYEKFDTHIIASDLIDSSNKLIFAKS